MYEEALNQILNAHSVAYKMINRQIVPFGEDPVYAATIEPTVRLLIDRRFKPAQAAFLNALREIQSRKPDDAITDAGPALQETLVELGCDGNTLHRLMADARRRGLLAGHDEKLTGRHRRLHGMGLRGQEREGRRPPALGRDDR